LVPNRYSSRATFQTTARVHRRIVITDDCLNFKTVYDFSQLLCGVCFHFYAGVPGSDEDDGGTVGAGVGSGVTGAGAGAGIATCTGWFNSVGKTANAVNVVLCSCATRFVWKAMASLRRVSSAATSEAIVSQELVELLPQHWA
jgi:hypothetical protein